MEGVRKLQIEDKEILIIDYSDCKETEMIRRLEHAKTLVQNENKPALILNILNDKAYLTPNFVRQSESVYAEVNQLIEKNAIIGVSQVQKMIIKGFTLLGNRKLQIFDTFDESIKYLIE